MQDISQETIAILAVGIPTAALGLILVGMMFKLMSSIGDLRERIAVLEVKIGEWFGQVFVRLTQGR